ncbi:MAG: Fic family protein [Oscillospiraceae bacterium]|nr:Fic family protein [Oscillospiraceae bacterium]
MKLEDYITGNYANQGDFKSFIPAPVDIPWEWSDTSLNMLLERASSEIGGLNAFAELVPNIDLYIKMHIRTEANKSSKIEGTKTSFEEDLMRVEDVSPEKRNDHVEVNNYVRALQHGINRITNDHFPLCLRLIREIHEVLMRGVRGEYRAPGEFRKSQNWIGGSVPSTAIFVPPSVPDMEDALSDFEKFLNNDTNTIPHLIKAAIAHYQFETIHPFLDGNGRVGRLIVPLYLLAKGVIVKPCFYISDYFERNRELYYAALDKPRKDNDLGHWIKFFLSAAIDTAKSAKNKFSKAVCVVQQLNERAINIKGRAENVHAILNAFYLEPLLGMKDICEKAGLPQATVSVIVNDMHKNELLEEITGFSRNKVYMLTDYVHAFKTSE